MVTKLSSIKSVVITALMSALVFLGIYIMRIEVVILGNHIMVHFGNMFCLLAAILFGRRCGALAGAIGMSLFDLISGRFIVYVPFVFILKYFMGFICGSIKNKYEDRFTLNKINLLSIIAALLFNIIFSPVISFFIKVVVYDLNFYMALMQTIGSIMSTIINACLSGSLALILLKFIEPIVINKK